MAKRERKPKTPSAPPAGVSRLPFLIGGVLVLLLCALWLSCHEYTRRMQPERDPTVVEEPLDDVEQPTHP